MGAWLGSRDAEPFADPAANTDCNSEALGTTSRLLSLKGLAACAKLTLGGMVVSHLELYFFEHVLRLSKKQRDFTLTQTTWLISITTTKSIEASDLEVRPASCELVQTELHLATGQCMSRSLWP